MTGSAVWAFAFAGAGYGLGTSYQRVHSDFRYAEYIVAAALATIALRLLRRRPQPREQRSELDR